MKLTLIFWLFLLLRAGAIFAAELKTEQKFQDPITTKSGKYTVKFPSETAKAKSYGLLVFLHGSGNTSGYAGIFASLETIAKEFELVPLAIQAPNNAVTWADDAQGPSTQHAAYVKSLLERVIFNAHPEIDPNRIVFAGLSAGSTFLSGDFLSRYMDQYKGGAVMLCGGGGPVGRTAGLYASLPKSLAQGFPLYFYIQKSDFLYGQTIQGIAYWKSRGAMVHAETPAGGGHCSFDVAQEMSRGVKFVLNAAKSH